MRDSGTCRDRPPRLRVAAGGFVRRSHPPSSSMPARRSSCAASSRRKTTWFTSRDESVGKPIVPAMRIGAARGRTTGRSTTWSSAPGGMVMRMHATAASSNPRSASSHSSGGAPSISNARACGSKRSFTGAVSSAPSDEGWRTGAQVGKSARAVGRQFNAPSNAPWSLRLHDDRGRTTARDVDPHRRGDPTADIHVQEHSAGRDRIDREGAGREAEGSGEDVPRVTGSTPCGPSRVVKSRLYSESRAADGR